jgi:hypothetical protein
MPVRRALKVNTMSQHAFNRSWSLFLLLFVLQTLPVLVKGQDLQVQQWQQGKVILTSGDTLSGSIVYHLKGEMLQVNQADGATKTFSPVNVASFTVFNEQTGRFQIFRSYLWSRRSEDGAFKAPAFFEVIAEGKYSLVEREAFTVRNQDPIPRYAAYGRYYQPCPSGNLRYQEHYSQVVAVKQFYVLTPEQEIVTLRNPRKDLPELFRDKAEVMNQFMKNKKLSYHNSTDLIPMIRHFNKL